MIVDVEEEGRRSPGEIHHDMKEGADVGVTVRSRRGKSTRCHEEIKKSEERAETRGWMAGKPHNCFSNCWFEYLRAHGVTHSLNTLMWQWADGANPGGFGGWFWRVSLKARPGDKQHFGIPCFSGASCASDKSCISDLSPQAVIFLSNRTFSVANTVVRSWDISAATQHYKGGGKNSWQDWLSAGALCVQHSWPVPSPQSACSLLFLFANTCLLTFEGVGEIGQICWLLGKGASFERLRPSSCWCCHDVISTALGAAWCFKGKGSATFLSHTYLPTLPRNDAALPQNWQKSRIQAELCATICFHPKSLHLEVLLKAGTAPWPGTGTSIPPVLGAATARAWRTGGVGWALCGLWTSGPLKRPLSSPAEGKEPARVQHFTREGWGRPPPLSLD